MGSKSLKHEQWKADLIRKRGYNCEWCKVRTATDLHHALIPRMKGKIELDAEENLMIACHSCHVGKELLDTQEVREYFWGVQCNRYGIDHMIKWMKSLPLKVKPYLYQ